MTEHVEVCVVGAGPAGATVAARLAALGHDVAILDRERFPRAHVGESLSPAALAMLDRLGVGERVASAGFTPTTTASVRWRDAHAERIDSPGGLTVDRGRFDAILLAQARETGARVLEGVRAARPVARHDDEACARRRPVAGDVCWELPVPGGRVRARYLVDATGRRRLLAGACATKGPRTLALHATWRGAPSYDGTQTRVDAIDDGWLWGAWLPEGDFRAMAFIDPQTLIDAGRDSAGCYRRLLAESALFAELLTGDAIASSVHVCDATTYAVASPIDERGVKVGEAAFAIDPLSSSGVHTAMQTGLAAAAAVHGILTPGADAGAAIEYYDDHVRHAAQRDATVAAALYAEHPSRAPFWIRRGAGDPPVVAGRPAGRSTAAGVSPRLMRAAVPPRASGAATSASRPALVGSLTAPLAGATLSALLALPVGLPQGAALRSTPCLVGDRIERRRALAHPAVDRPVAFLGGSELAPLLDMLQDAPTLGHAIRGWERCLPGDRAEAIARWLLARGLLVARPVAP